MKTPAKPNRLNTRPEGAFQNIDALTGVPANTVVLTACIAEVQTLRYTPAGIPALQLVLLHQSEVQDLQGKRQVKLVLKAIAFGALAERLASQVVGSNWRFRGYLSNSRAGKSVVLQIQDFSQELL